MIIDTHTHLGETLLFDADIREQVLVSTLEEHAVDAAVVQPFPGAPSPPSVHDRIAAMAEENPGRFFGMVSMPPIPNVEAFQKEARRCIRDLGFVGIKLHTVGHPIFPTSRVGMSVFELASELGVPVMVHTGLGLPLASPSLVIPAAQRFPELPVILAHAGYAIAAAEALVVAQICPNIYLEPSWTQSKMTGAMIRELGADRVMFGSDLPENVASELAKLRSLNLSKDELRTVFAGTANKVFNLGVSENQE